MATTPAPYDSNLHWDEWKEYGKYEKAYFKSPIPSLTITKSTFVRVFKGGDNHFHYIIHMNGEIRQFLSSLVSSLFYHTQLFSLMEHTILLSVHDGKLFVTSNKAPVIFDEEKHPLSTANYEGWALVKITAECLSKVKDSRDYRVFFNVDQILCMPACCELD